MADLVHVKGLKELATALQQLPIAVARKQMAGPVSKGARLVRDAARNKAPVYTGDVSKGHPAPGTLRKSILMKRVMADTKSDVIARFIVTVRRGKKYQSMGKKGVNLDAFYWWFVENGTRNMEARPFLRPAFEQEKFRALNVIAEGLRQGVDTEAKNYSWGKP